MASNAAVSIPAPGPLLMAPYAGSIYSHFRWISVGAAVSHILLLVLLAGKRNGNFVSAVIIIAYFLLFMNLLVISRVGWRLFSSRTRTTSFVLFVVALFSLVVWLLADMSEEMPRVIAYVSAALAAFSWIGVLGLLRSVVENADERIQDSFQRSGAISSIVVAGEEPSPSLSLNLHAPNLGQVLSKIPSVFSAGPQAQSVPMQVATRQAFAPAGPLAAPLPNEAPARPLAAPLPNQAPAEPLGQPAPVPTAAVVAVPAAGVAAVSSAVPVPQPSDAASPPPPGPAGSAAPAGTPSLRSGSSQTPSLRSGSSQAPAPPSFAAPSVSSLKDRASGFVARWFS
jgi:hypothetical protein